MVIERIGLISETGILYSPIITSTLQVLVPSYVMLYAPEALKVIVNLSPAHVYVGTEGVTE